METAAKLFLYGAIELDRLLTDQSWTPGKITEVYKWLDKNVGLTGQNNTTAIITLHKGLAENGMFDPEERDIQKLLFKVAELRMVLRDIFDKPFYVKEHHKDILEQTRDLLVEISKQTM